MAQSIGPFNQQEVVVRLRGDAVYPGARSDGQQVV
jgi:hypothetical protein